MGETTVVVLTQPLDVTADYVVAELSARSVPVFRCDLAQFPQTLSVAARLADGGWRGTLHLPSRGLDLDEVGWIYYRRPTMFTLPEHLNQVQRHWSLRQARLGLGGVLAAHPWWLNHPADIAAAEYKPVQLALAAQAGLTVPPTLITNDAEQARRFAQQHGTIYTKPLAPGLIIDESTAKLLYATQITAADIDDTVAVTAHLFQRAVPKAYEVRLTVVDGNHFAVRIDADSPDARVDWRSDYPHLRYQPITTPQPIRTAVDRLMTRLRLRYGALDFVVTPDNEWVFLEINPNGQWAWIQDATGLPIAAAIADALTQELTP